MNEFPEVPLHTQTWAMRDAAGKVTRVVQCTIADLKGCTPDGMTVEPFDGHELDHEQPDPAAEARARRAQLLAASDWTQLRDIAPASGWTEYRAALRDIPAQPGFPDKIEWPEIPSTS